MNKKKQIFVCYSEHEEVVNKLISWLRKQLRVDADIWTDKQLRTQSNGKRYKSVISNKITDSKIAILLISEDFVTSDYIKENELPHIKKNYEAQTLEIIAILLANVTLRSKEAINWIYDLGIYPDESIPLIDYEHNYSMWDRKQTEILTIIHNKIEEIDEQSSITAISKVKFNNTTERSALTLIMNQDDFPDEDHLYKRIKRIDTCDFVTGIYSSYRWILIQNVSESSTYSMKHRECGENKIRFNEMKINATETRNGEKVDIVVKSLDKNKNESTKTHDIEFVFNRPLKPQETVAIFYQLDWPEDRKYITNKKQSDGIPLNRYPRGIEEVIFGILVSDPVSEISIKVVIDQFSYPPKTKTTKLFSVQDDPDLESLHEKTLSGRYFTFFNIKENITALMIEYTKK